MHDAGPLPTGYMSSPSAHPIHSGMNTPSSADASNEYVHLPNSGDTAPSSNPAQQQGNMHDNVPAHTGYAPAPTPSSTNSAGSGNDNHHMYDNGPAHTGYTPGPSSANSVGSGHSNQNGQSDTGENNVVPMKEYFVKHVITLDGIDAFTFNNNDKVRDCFTAAIANTLTIPETNIYNVRACESGQTEEECINAAAEQGNKRRLRNRKNRRLSASVSDVRYEIKADSEEEMQSIFNEIPGMPQTEITANFVDELNKKLSNDEVMDMTNGMGLDSVNAVPSTTASKEVKEQNNTPATPGGTVTSTTASPGLPNTPLPTTGPGASSATACNNKLDGDQCSFTYGGGPKAGQLFSGACIGGVCGAAAGPDGPPQEENPHFACPVLGETPYTGTDAYTNKNGQPSAAPLRGNVGCVDQGPLTTRHKGKAGRTVLDATDIYAAMEAGFTKNQPGAACLAAGNNLPDFELPGGIDTNLAEAIMHKACEERGGVFSQALLDYCGGHADPFHYHERMNCLYTADSVTGHSTRIGTAADGNGIYGHNINGGCEPTDLDWCGGRTGVTPDSEGQSVYYYVVSNRAPFTLGCFGPINTEAECRSLYPECDGVAQSVTTAHGTDDYDLDCPCFNPITGGNMPGQGKPKFLGPNGFDSYQLDLMNGERACNDDDGTSRPCTQDEKDAVSALYSSQKCSDGPTAPGTGSDTSPTAPGTGTVNNIKDFCGKGTQWDDENQYCVATYDGILNACRTARKEWAFTCDMMVTCDAGANTATGKDESYLSICNTCADQKIVQQFVTSDCYECGRRCIACLNVPDHLEADAKDADGNPCSTCSSCDKYRPCAPDDSGTTAT
jgi:hypothetical protein